MLICYMLLYLSGFPEIVSSAVVTLDSMKIYNTHGWLKTSKPILYFTCKGENKTVLPDVKEVNISYSFNGEESWQPLTLLTSIKCKRCGFYEQDTLKPDDEYDEWELCPSDFHSSNGLYMKKKKNEFDTTFLCPQCVTLAAEMKKLCYHFESIGDSSFFGTNTGAKVVASSPVKDKGIHIAVVILISVQVSTVLALVILGVHRYWQKKKREQDQARFMKLFEEVDDIEDELDVEI